LASAKKVKKKFHACVPLTRGWGDDSNANKKYGVLLLVILAHASIKP
jgi:hypothetical protein